MESNVSDLVVGLMMAVFGLIGLFLVAGAADVEMYIFGLRTERVRCLFRFRPDQAPLRPARRRLGRSTGTIPMSDAVLTDRPVIVPSSTMTRW